MTKKRNASGRGTATDDGPNTDLGDSRKRIRTYEDVADSDDEFHLNRDKVLLDEEPAVKRGRKWQEQADFLQLSDEEVLVYSEPEEDEPADKDAQRQGQSQADGFSASEDERGQDEDEGVGWGTSKADLYGADAIETEEQALEEEAEALRLQKKQLESMTAAAYGFDEDEWQDVGKADDTLAGKQDNAVVTEVLPQLELAEDTTPAERFKLLKSRYPEFEPLSKELLGLQNILPGLAQDADAVRSSTQDEHLSNALIKFRAASAYAGVLAMYFTLLTSTAAGAGSRPMAMSASLLRNHPVMESLIKSRTLWTESKDLPSDSKPSHALEPAVVTSNGATAEVAETSPVPRRDSKPKKSRAQRHAEAAKAAAEARRAERMKRTEADLADLDTLAASGKHRKPARPKSFARASEHGNDSDFGEDAPLTAQEAAEKAQRKKSLRFYTSQIAQKANKRGAAGRNAGGDDDIPCRERVRDRQARLNAEAEKRGRKQADGGDVLSGESDEEDREQTRQIRDQVDEGDYYDMVAARTAKSKSEKAAFAEAQRQAALQGGQIIQQEEVGPNGKRKISYVIEKNKGLTPHRKKDVRNPRVKKRKKYDEKKKKLASMKPVYKGGEGRGGYGGELTGIKKRLVKSTKL